jgi:WS/DGAT/MGAT family acyltransferase
VVPAADAFFWCLEADAPQQAGGVGLFVPSPKAEAQGQAAPSLEQVRDRVAASLATFPEFRERLEPGSGWRRPRWGAVERLDLDQHVTEHDLTTASGEPGGVAALNEYVSQLAAEPLPADRPMWSIVLVRGVAVDQSALVLLVHHTIADGLGVIEAVERLLEAHETERLARTASGRGAGIDATARRYAGALRRAAGALRRAAGPVVGLAQLATDGSPHAPLTRVSSPQRDFASTCMDLDTMVAVAARHGCHVTDVLLGAVAAGFSNGRPDLTAAVGSRLRVAVPLPILGPRSDARSGNVTSGVMIDLPLDPMPLAQRLAVIAQQSRRLRTPTRALASRAVLARGLSLVPPRVGRWFARTVYGHRFFHGIVSNMEGSDQQLWLGEAKLASVVPILPLAAAAPLAVGALGWNGSLGIGVATDPTVLSAAQLCAHIEAVMHELADTTVVTGLLGC